MKNLLLQEDKPVSIIFILYGFSSSKENCGEESARHNIYHYFTHKLCQQPLHSTFTNQLARLSKYNAYATLRIFLFAS